MKVPVRAWSSHLHYKKEVGKSRSLRLGFLVFIPVSAAKVPQNMRFNPTNTGINFSDSAA